jgi:hypothetical protein
MENPKLLRLKGITVEIMDHYGNYRRLWTFDGYVMYELCVFLNSNTMIIHNRPENYDVS